MIQIEIASVKIQGDGYLVNGKYHVPKANGNAEYEAVKEWLKIKENTPEPEFTEAELTQQAVDKKIAEAKVYLASTDFKMTVDYFATLTVEQQEELTMMRAAARDFLKEQGL